MKEAARNQRLNLIVMHGDALEEAKFLYEEFKKIKGLTNIQMGQVGPVTGVHTGPGTIGVAYYPE